MRRRIEKAPLPDPVTLRRLVAERAAELSESAVVIDADAQGSTGVDVLMVGEGGRPVFVDVLTDVVESIPARVFEHLAWMDDNRRLFLRAYARDGVRETDAPEVVFVAERFPRGVLLALPALRGARVRLVRAEHLLIDGESELFLEEVASTLGEAGSVASASDTEVVRLPRGQRGEAMTAGPDESATPASRGLGEAAPRVSPGDGTAGQPRLSRVEDRIESESVQGLLKLFRSGVDGLDGRIVETESNGGTAFQLSGRPLARVSVSPGSFTVTPGDRVANPIVVSDRVSLERALNAVVSLFVREEQPDARESGGSAADVLNEAERAELVGIWGSGLSGGEN